MDSQTKLEQYHFHEQDWDSYEELRSSFDWQIPDTFNMATYACDRWADGTGRVAIYAEGLDEEDETYTYDRLADLTARLATYLKESGVERGDRVGVFTPQAPATLIAHLAAWKIGAVSIPLATLLGPDGAKYRLADSESVACMVDESCLDVLREVEPQLDDLETVLTVGADRHPNGEEPLWETIENTPPAIDAVETDPTDDATIIYTSGTTGEPKGVLHAHQLLLGHLPFFLTCYNNLELPERVVLWTPVEWSWIGSLYSGIMPTLYYGKSVLAYDRDSFDPEAAFRVIHKYNVTNYGGPPTTLRMMKSVENPAERFDLDSVRVVVAGGEAVGPDITKWADETFGGATIHEGYGQTEYNVGLGDCTALFEFKEGTMGKPVPGHEVTVVDEVSTEPMDPGEIGELAFRYEGSPVSFKRYVNKPEKTASKVKDGWLLSEDLTGFDEEGYFSFKSRKDDVIISSGYKIGPEEIEDTLVDHPKVANAGVIGVPDEERGQVPKAFVVLDGGTTSSDQLRLELQSFVKEQLAKYEYPRELEFIDELPTTSTGKVRRLDLEKREGLVD